jgi:hypothetical protein
MTLIRVSETQDVTIHLLDFFFLRCYLKKIGRTLVGRLGSVIFPLSGLDLSRIKIL